jgi:hypothetical protein
MMNCSPRRDLLHLRALLGSCIAMIALVLLCVQPVAAQADAVGPVYALPGTLTGAVNRAYGTILTTADSTEYGLVGQTPDIEAQIVQLRLLGPDLEVKVWGDRFAAVNADEREVIVVSSILTTEAEDSTPVPSPENPETAPVATPTPVPTAVSTPAVPVAVITGASVNVRSGPGTEYPPVGSLVAGQTCTVIGRNQAITWWQLSCPGAVSGGWVFGELLALAGPVANVPVVQTAPPPTPAPTFVNWRSSFFANRDLAGAPVLAVDLPTINFNWGNGSPGDDVPSDNFSARFERTLDFSYGTYEIAVTMDDGARLYIDDQRVLNDWNIGSARTQVVRQVLSGSRRLRLEYFEATGTARVQLSINLISSSEAWQVSYYANTALQGSPVVTRGEPRAGSFPLDYNWGGGAPANGVSADNWSARWVGSFSFDNGDYRFSANVDDGIRVYIDGIRIIDRWQNGYQVDVNNTFRNLGAGNHQIIVEYYEATGNALLRVSWQRVGGGGGGDNSGGGRPRDE